MFFSPRRTRPVAARPRHAHARRGVAVAVAAVAMLGLAACSSASAESSSAGSQQSATGSPSTVVFGPGKRPAVPDITGTTLSGAKLSLAHFRGHVLVLNFWGSWCTPCREEAKTLGLLSRQYSSAGVKFLGVDVRDSRASAEAYMHDFGITYPSLNDPAGQVALAFRDTVPPAAIPTTLVVSAKGWITGRVIGPVSYQGLRDLISAAMGPAS